MGELLGPAKRGGDRSRDSSVTVTLENDGKQARKQARKLAAVPAPRAERRYRAREL